MPSIAEKSDLSPLAQKVYAAFEGDRTSNIQNAVLGEPIPSFDPNHELHSLIEDWGLCVGVSYAVAAHEEPFAGLGAVAVLAEEIAREVWSELHPEAAPGGSR